MLESLEFLLSEQDVLERINKLVDHLEREFLHHENLGLLIKERVLRPSILLQITQRYSRQACECWSSREFC